MESNLINKAKLNALSGYINYGITCALGFFIQPHLIRFLGDSSFGILKQIQKLMDFASVADGRAGQALKWIIANKSNSTVEEKQQAVGSSLKIWTYFLPLLIFAIVIIVHILPFSIHNIDVNSYYMVRIAGFILGINMVLNPLFQIPDAILVGVNETHKATFSKTFWHIISTFLMIYVAYLGYGIVGITLVTLGISFLNGITIFIICKHSIKWFGIKRPDKKQVSSFFNFSFWVLIWTFVIRLFLVQETLLIGWLIGAEEITHYTVTAYLYVTALSIGLMTTSAAMPGLGNMYGKKDFSACKKIVKSVREINLFIISVFACVILLLNKNFVALWMGESYYMGDWVNLLIIILMIQLMLIRNEGQIQDISLIIRDKVLYGFLAAVLGLILGIILYKFTNQIETIFTGLIAGRIFTSFKFSNLVNKIFNVKNEYNKMYIMGSFLVICCIIRKYIPFMTNWITFIIMAVLLAIIVLVVNFMLLLSKHTKKTILRTIIPQFLDNSLKK